nr:PfkB family carbohydrate kinase [Chloroflexota bacterium]
RDIVERLTAAGVPVAIDTYGVQLTQALAARPTLVKINAHEAAALVGRTADEPVAALAAAAEIQAWGARSVVITLGARGAVGIDADGQRFAWAAPHVSGLYTVGSGDSFLAGLITALGEGQSLADAARLGVAAGAANTEEIGAAVLTRTRVEELRDQARLLVV